MDLKLDELFREAMSHLASGVAVITARRPDGRPCGIAATSLDLLQRAPAVAAGLGLARLALPRRARGVRALRRAPAALRPAGAGPPLRRPRGRGQVRGARLGWDEDVPELAGALAYLRCRRAENFVRYDHTVLIGDLEAGRLEQGEPLVYARRRMDWLMQP